VYTLVIQPPYLPRGEYTYTCDDDHHLRRVVSALTTLNVEVIDVMRGDASLTAEEFQNLLGE
jgi:hypothetical protein